jgi:hypothetical protein
MAETHQSETPQERPMHPWQPLDPRIPFFPFSSLYYEYLKVAHPDWARLTPFLLEPGLHSIEVYEAILYKKTGIQKHLQAYVSRCGLSSFLNPRKNTKYGWGPGMKVNNYFRLLKPYDVSFILLNKAESWAVIRWMSVHSFTSGLPDLASPKGLIRYFTYTTRHTDVSRHEDIVASLHALFGSLGIDQSKSPRVLFPRSLLPPGVKPTSLIHRLEPEYTPAPDSPELHSDVWRTRERVHWNLDNGSGVNYDDSINPTSKTRVVPVERPPLLECVLWCFLLCGLIFISSLLSTAY